MTPVPCHPEVEFQVPLNLTLFHLLVAMFAYLGGTTHVDVSPEFGIPYQGAYVAAIATCAPDGTTSIVFGSGSSRLTYPHEFLHAVHCMYAHGNMDAPSPEPGGCLTLPSDCRHSWVQWALAHPEDAAKVIAALR